MIAVVTVLSAFALGYFFRSRLAAMTAYAVAYLWAFVFQTLFLLLDALGGGANPAFEPGKFPLSYGLVTLTIFAVGLGLVEGGHRVRARRGGREAGSVPEPAVA
jgi:Na+-driven multidrug efflux pump